MSNPGAQKCGGVVMVRSSAAILLTLLLHAVSFIALGYIFAHEKPVVKVDYAFAIAIEFAEVEAAPDITPHIAVSEPVEPAEIVEPVEVVETIVEPVEPMPLEPVLTQEEPAPVAVETVEETVETVEIIEPVDVVDVVDVVDFVEPSDHAGTADNNSVPAEAPHSSAAASSSSAQAPDTLPRARNTIKPPPYPLDAKRRGEEGTVVCEMSISEKGVVTAVELVKSSGFPELDRAARRALFNARFTPATRNGAPVPFRLQQSVIFTLTN